MDAPGTATEDAAALVAALAAWAGRLWPDADRGQAFADGLLERYRDDRRTLDGAVVAEVEASGQAYARHFALELEERPAPPDTDPPGWPPADEQAALRRAGWVSGVTRRPDGVGVVRIDNLDPVALAAPYLEAAFALVRGAAGVVLDLRENGGGDPATVARVLDWVVGPVPAHVSDVHYRDRVRSWWTAGRPARDALPRDVPAAVAVSGRTFSSGEALAYHAQQLCRLPVVGRPSRGAADHITPLRLTPHVTAFLPEAYVVDATSGTTWEGTGVVPDVPCDDPDAVDVAAGLLVTGSLPRRGTPPT